MAIVIWLWEVIIVVIPVVWWSSHCYRIWWSWNTFVVRCSHSGWPFLLYFWLFHSKLGFLLTPIVDSLASLNAELILFKILYKFLEWEQYTCCIMLISIAHWFLSLWLTPTFIIFLPICKRRYLTSFSSKCFVRIETNFQIVTIFILFEYVIFVISQIDSIGVQGIDNIKIRKCIHKEIQIIV